MDEVRRWSVTYTKHMKQKRKVYQDGFLALYTGSRKVKLYDECENVLEIRILKDDEVVKAGETLTFCSHIVDVGNSEGGDDKPSDNDKSENKVMSVARSFGVRPTKRFRSPICADSCKIKVEKDESPDANPSASQKLIREFKKAELQKYVVTKSSPVTNESSVTEWIALYSTQTMKKAKIYHDGYVSLVSSGLRGRKVMLYDSRRNLLDCRFLKSDESVKAGESLSLDGHIVEIGELEVKKPGNDNVVKEMNSNSVKELINSHRLKKSPVTIPTEAPHKDASSAELLENTNSNVSDAEWLVLYTTQLTQKNKKFHDGFLSLTHCGSQGRKVMLYDTSRRLLDSRFLKCGEYISPDESLSFGCHLVNVGEPHDKQMFSIELVTQRNETAVSRGTKSTSGHQDFVKASETLVCNRNVANLSTASQDKIHTIKRIPLEEASPRYCILGHDKGSIAGSSCNDDNRSSNAVPTNKPLRDVSGILSSLQRPGSNDKFTPCGHIPAVDHRLNHSHFQSPLTDRHVVDTQSGQAVLGIREEVANAFNGGPGEEFSNRTAALKSGVLDNSVVSTKLESPDGFGDPAPRSVQEFYNRLEQTSMDGCQIVDSAKNLGVMEERELKTTSFRHNVSSAYEEIHFAKPAADICSKENLAMSSLTEILTRSSSHILEYNEVENLKKDASAEPLPSNKLFESSVFDSSPVVQKSISYMDDWPSFDLGFE